MANDVEKHLQRRLVTMKRLNLVVKVFGEEIVIGGVAPNEYSLVCLVKDVGDEIKGVDRKREFGVIGVDEMLVLAQLPWCNEIRIIQTDKELLEVFVQYDDHGRREIDLTIQPKALEVIPNPNQPTPEPVKPAPHVVPTYIPETSTNRPDQNRPYITPPFPISESVREPIFSRQSSHTRRNPCPTNSTSETTVNKPPSEDEVERFVEGPNVGDDEMHYSDDSISSSDENEEYSDEIESEKEEVEDDIAGEDEIINGEGIQVDDGVAGQQYEEQQLGFGPEHDKRLDGYKSGNESELEDSEAEEVCPRNNPHSKISAAARGVDVRRREEII